MTKKEIFLPGLEIQAPGPSASVASALHLILSLSSPGKTLEQLCMNSKQKSRHGNTIRSWQQIWFMLSRIVIQLNWIRILESVADCNQICITGPIMNK